MPHLHNLPPQVLLPIQRNAKTTKKQDHSPKCDSGAGDYGSATKISQVYPYEFCEIFTACLSRCLGRDPCASHLSLVIDLLQYSGDSHLVGISDLVDTEYSYLSENPLKESKLMQGSNNIRSGSLVTRTIFCLTRLSCWCIMPSPSSLDALVKDVTHLWTRLFPELPSSSVQFIAVL